MIGEYDGYKVYTCETFPYTEIQCDIVQKSKKTFYYNYPNTFDIETTSIIFLNKEDMNKSYAFMYIWQGFFFGRLVAGRTWREYRKFIATLTSVLDKATILIYCHNLAFEFQYLRNVFPVTRVFAKAARRVVKATMANCEYRCSYTLSNMSLEKWCEHHDVKHKKLVGDLDYSILRYWDTELSEQEYAYCFHDVIGQNECLMKLFEEDNAVTIPLTSTGYVRRDYREVCIADKEHMKQFHKKRLSVYYYDYCKEIFRGGVAGSNVIWTNEILVDVDFWDKKSSYPFQLATKEFPCDTFSRYTAQFGSDKFQHLIDSKACLITFKITELKVKNRSCIPYIALHKCTAISKENKCGNGKVYYAKEVLLKGTEIDFKIITEYYSYKDIVILDINCASKSLLSKPFRKKLMDMFQIKEDTRGNDYEYNKYKNKINASFGMEVTDILNDEVIFSNTMEAWKTRPCANKQSALNKYYWNENSFLSYQDGVWCTAYGRQDLYEGLSKVGIWAIATDTDSIATFKDRGEVFEDINRKIIERAESFDIKPYAYDKKGNKIYLGVWELDKSCYDFLTLGSKKYCYNLNKDDSFHITVAGLDKKKGGEYLKEWGEVYAMHKGFQVPPSHSGRKVAVYNDIDHMDIIFINGHKQEYTSNMVLIPTEYTFGLTGEWDEFIENKYKGDIIYYEGCDD